MLLTRMCVGTGADVLSHMLHLALFAFRCDPIEYCSIELPDTTTNIILVGNFLRKKFTIQQNESVDIDVTFMPVDIDFNTQKYSTDRYVIDSAVTPIQCPCLWWFIPPCPSWCTEAPTMLTSSLVTLTSLMTTYTLSSHLSTTHLHTTLSSTKSTTTTATLTTFSIRSTTTISTTTTTTTTITITESPMITSQLSTSLQTTVTNTDFVTDSLRNISDV